MYEQTDAVLELIAELDEARRVIADARRELDYDLRTRRLREVDLIVWTANMKAHGILAKAGR